MRKGYPAWGDVCGSMAAVALVSGALQATTGRAQSVWDGGAANAAWGQGLNWSDDTQPSWGADTEIIFYASGAARLSNYLGAGRTLGRLAFNADADGDVTIRTTTTAGGSTVANLTLLVTAGYAQIETDADAQGNFRVSDNAGSIILGSDLLVNHNGSGLLTLARPIEGAGRALVKSGSGVCVLNNDNTFDGGVTLNAGTLRVNHNNALGTGTLTVHGGTLAAASGTGRTLTNSVVLAAGLTVGDTNITGALTLNGDVSGLGGVLKMANSTLTLGGTNTYAGGTTLNAGTLKFGVDNGLGSGPVTLNGGELASTAAVVLTNGLSLGGAVEIDTAGGQIDLLGVVSGSGSIYKAGGGELNLRSANTFSGGVTNQNGTLRVKDANALGTGVLVVQGSGTMYWDGKFEDANGGRGVTNDIVLLAFRNFNTLGSGNRVKLSGVLSGTGGISRNSFSGSTLILTGDNTFEGGFLTQTGHLLLGHTNALGRGAMTWRNQYEGNFLGAVTDLSDGRGVPNDILLMSNLVVQVTNDLQLSGCISLSPEALMVPQVVKQGSAALTLSGTNTFLGGMIVEAGALRLAENGALPTDGPVTLAGGALDMGACTNAPSSLSVTTDSALALGAGRLAFTAQAGDDWTGRLALTGVLERYTLRFLPPLSAQQLGQIDYEGGGFYQSSDGYLRTFPRGTIIRVQ